MITNKDIKFPYYSGNIKLTKSLGCVNLEQFINAHKYPTDDTRAIINLIKNCEDPKHKRKLKHGLFSFTPNVFIKKWNKRSYKNIDYYTGLMQLDFDNINDNKLAIDLKHWIYMQPECVVSYLSPSGGVKALIKIKKAKDEKHYKAIHKSVTEKYQETGYFDEATKNAVLPLFLSIDELILSRDYSEAKTWTKENFEEINYVALNNEQPPNFNSSDEYSVKTIEILNKKINNIVDNGHPQVRNAALVLGSRCAAGYLNLQEAIQYMELFTKRN